MNLCLEGGEEAVPRLEQAEADDRGLQEQDEGDWELAGVADSSIK